MTGPTPYVHTENCCRLLQLYICRSLRRHLPILLRHCSRLASVRIAPIDVLLLVPSCMLVEPPFPTSAIPAWLFPEFDEWPGEGQGGYGGGNTGK